MLLGFPSAHAQPAADVVTAEALDADSIRARIDTLKTQTDIVAGDKQLTLDNLQTALARLESAQAARKLADEYAEALKQAPARIAELQAELARPQETGPRSQAVDTDPATAPLRMAALQIKAVSLRTQRRALDETLRSMASRELDARQELSELRAQLEKRPDPLPDDASQVLIDSNQIKDDAVRQDLSARIEKTEQEILSLPTRESIASAQQRLLGRELDLVMADMSELGRRMDAREQEEVRSKLEQAEAVVRDTAGKPDALITLAKDNLALRRSMFDIANELRKLWSTKDRLYGQLEEVATSRKNADQILAFGRIDEEYGRLLREVAKKLPGQASLDHRIAERRNAIIDARVGRFRSEQQLAQAGTGALAANRFLATHDVAESPEVIAATEALLRQRRDALTDLRAIQGRQVEALDELNQLEGELQQRSRQLRSMLDQRLLWLPSSTPIGKASAQQVAAGFGKLVATGNLATLWPAIGKSWSSRPVRPIVLATVVFVLLVMRKRLLGRLASLAQPVGTRSDRFGLTIGALLVTILLAIPVPLAFATIGLLFVQPFSPNSYASAVGAGLNNVGIVLFILGLFRNMCRRHGLFVAHFHWEARSVRRLGKALWVVSLALVPAVWLSGVARTSGDPVLNDGLGRLGVLIISLALAVFTHRVFRPSGGAMTGSLDRSGLLWRTRHLWYWALIATPLVLAGIAMAGYAVSAGELQARMITSGWVLLAIIIAFQIAMRGVVVAGRQAAWRQAESRRLKQREEALANAAADTGGEGAPVLPDDPDIDVVTVSQQTRGLLRAASAVLLVLLLWGTWSGLIPALGIFNDIVLWSSVTTTASGQVVGAITLGHVLLSVVLLGLTFFAARNLPGFLEVVVLHRFDIDAGTRYAYVTITRYGILAIGLLFAFSHIGADWSKLQWIIAALGVGLGFGLQEIVANFVSGIIILFERPVRVGDLITIGDTVGTVSRIKIRAITITDPDNFEVLVPNKAFITGTVKNWSLTSQITRLVIKVGVAYGSDVARAQQIMLDVAEANEQVLETPAPIVLFLGFGDSSLDLELRVFVGRIDHRLSTVNNLHLAIDKAFREAGIEIPFPQRDVHLHGLAPDESNKADPTDASESGTVTGSKYSK
ncbi:MAG: mechanosensitive ion channel [Dokdonella sp.]|nr:mechanosensitive ion channel [Dokdonella sp.]MCB1574676.1 mechanosensitive ion channel [Xanthomonadales bacterium]